MKRLARRPRRVVDASRCSRRSRRRRTRSATSRSTRFSRVQVSGDRVYVRYVLDMAEIPTFQAKQAAGSTPRAYAKPARRPARTSTRRRPPGPARRRRSTRSRFPQGAGGPAHDAARGASSAARAIARHEPDRLPRRELRGPDRLAARSSSARTRRAAATSCAPTRRICSPARWTSRDAAATARARRADPPPGADAAARRCRRPTASPTRGFASLIVHDHLSTGFVAALAADRDVLGRGARALARATASRSSPPTSSARAAPPRHAVFLGLTVTVTHTIGVFALGLVTLSLSAFIVPDQLYPWLNLVSALLIVGVGLSVLRWRVREWRKGAPAPTTTTTHDHGHSHGHAPPSRPRPRAQPGAACSGSASPAGSSRARPRSSSCSRRSRCTGSATGSS